MLVNTSANLACIYTSGLPKDEYEVIIVGAGVLGSAMASALGRDGRTVLLIERDWSQPDRIVGELLQPGGINALRKLGLEECVEGIDGILVKGYVVFKDKEHQVLTYPKAVNSGVRLRGGQNKFGAACNDHAGNEYSNDHANGSAGISNNDTMQSLGVSFHHGRFVTNLRRAARSAPNVTCLEGTVGSLLKSHDGGRVIGVSVSVKSDSETEQFNLRAPLTIVADGCFSKFRKQVNSALESKQRSNFVGLVLTDCALPYPHYGHVVLAKPSPILLYQIGTHDTRILVDVPGKLPSAGNGELKEYMKTIIAHQLPKTIQPSFLSAVETDRLRSMPNSFLPPSTNKQEGVILLGDAMNMRHPLTGGGMTVALWDVVHVRELLSRDKVAKLSDSRAVISQMKSLHWRRKPLASVVNILAMALYDLFSAGDNAALRDLQAACFGYFKLGGRCVSTPVGLLAGLIPSPLTLVGHFFAVALYGSWMICSRDPIYKLPMNIVRSVQVLWKAVCVIGPVALSELKP
ncbi:hypothetical protein SeLEV6574_g02162 [Synchytrium endobioticum]|uniref:Squalene monooxygenase n=1 Tax=Synchytrium endobioticum TaxID=286115 RepID=A0A507D983_9FUNG|nr:hypothetical protein SeLEV6574_g02162 [Synchytrium endobioticum]